MPPKKTTKSNEARETTPRKVTPAKTAVRRTRVRAAAAEKKVSVRAKPEAEEAAAEKLTPAKEQAEKDLQPERYWEAVGRRKTATARVRLFTRGDKDISVNGKPLAGHFLQSEFQRVATEALDTMNTRDRFRVSAKVSGGGLHAQAEAVRHATARALVLFNPDFRKRLKRAGYLTRDPRMKERKKFGLKGARRAPQWQKR